MNCNVAFVCVSFRNELNQLTNYIEESIEALSYNFIQPELEQDIIASRHQMQTKRAEYLVFAF